MPAKIKDPASHFWSRIERLGEDECWAWTGARNKDGYGSIHFVSEGYREWLAHRVAFYLANGWVPHGRNRRGTLSIRHTCDNRACCNPAHLIIGTHQQNMDDCVQRGRLNDRRGEKHPRAKLTYEIVAKIRGGYFRGLSDRKIGEMFGVSGSAVARARTEKNWRSANHDASGVTLEVVQ